MAHTLATRVKVRLLREQGWALRQIANEVGVALSTVSVWVRDIRPPLSGSAESPDTTRTPEEIEAGAVRLCGRCLRDLPLTSFNRHPKGHQWWCRDCYRAYFGARAARHRDQVRSARRQRQLAARSFVADRLRSSRCSDCGEADDRVLEFDHLADKRANPADMVRAGASTQSIQRELSKCAVVCVNCHRIRTAMREGSWRLEPSVIDHDPRLTPGERRNMRYVREFLMRARCVDCGDPRLAVLEFDHVGSKAGNVTELARRGLGLERLVDEISQCEIRCANCHRRRTHCEQRECPRQDSNLQPSP